MVDRIRPTDSDGWDPQERTPEGQVPPEVRDLVREPVLREEGLQTPHVRDLTAYPPSARECLRIRLLMRDQADGDLAAVLRREIEDHVHECAECDRALSRAEFEVLRLRRAVSASEPSGAEEPPAGFTARVMSAVRSARVAEATELELQGPAAPIDFTPRVMERVRKEWDRPRRVWDLWSGRRQWVSRVAVAAALLCVAVGAGLQLFATEPSTAFTVSQPRDAQIVSATGSRAARSGDALPSGSELQVGEAGGALVLFGNATSRVALLGAARLAAFGEVGQERLELAGGEFALTVGDALRVAVRHNGQLALGAGQYRVSTSRVERVDGRLSPRVFARTWLEVEQGECRVLRGGLPEVVVSAGMTAEFDSWSPVTIEPAFDPGLIRSAGPVAVSGPGTAEVPFPPGTLLGQVVDARTGRGVAGATVEFRTKAGDQVVQTDAEGQYSLRDLAVGIPAAVKVFPPPAADEDEVALAVLGPRVFRLDATPARGGVQRLPELRLLAERRIAGAVLDPVLQPLAGANVRACVIDEVRGSMRDLPRGRARTLADGRFDLRLPAELGVHEVLAVVVEHVDYPATASLALAGHADPTGRGPLEIRVAAPRSVMLAGLAPTTEVHVIEGLPGLPAGAAVSVHRGRTDGEGRLLLSGVGSGPFWERGRPSALAMTVETPGIDDGPRLAGDALPELVGVSPAGGTWLPFVEDRYHALGVAELGAPLAAGEQRLLVSVAGPEFARPGTQLFRVERETRRMTFLGEYQGEAIPVVSAAGEAVEIVGIAPDGAVGVLTLADRVAATHRTLRVLPTGRASLHEGLRPQGVDGVAPTLVRFEMEEGAFKGMVLYREMSGRDAWIVNDLVPGIYRVSFAVGGRIVEASCTVLSGQLAEIKA